MDTESEGEAFENLSLRFIDWLKQNGTIISPKIELTDLRHRNAGRGVVAKDDIEEGEDLFNIPNPSILTVETSSMPVDLKNALDDPWLSLILAMVWEARQGQKSKWRSYFDVLPEKFDTLMYWPEEELEYLKDSAILEKIGKASANRTFTEQLIPVVRQHEAIFDASALDDDELLKLFHRMGSTIMAYAFDLENAASRPTANDDGWEEDSDADEILPKGMVPLADMLNADADLNNARLFYEDDKVVMKSIKPIKKGEELFNDYGPLPRADVLRRYGYITDNYAIYDVVEVSLDLVKTVAKEQLDVSEKDVGLRIEYLAEEGAIDDSYDIARSSSEDGPFSDEFKILLNALSMAPADFEKLKKKGKLPKPELPIEALSLLDSILIRRRSMYPTDAGFALQNGHKDTQDSKRRRAMASKVIEGEKEVLQEATGGVQDILDRSTKRKLNNVESETTPIDNTKRQRHSEVG